MKDGRNICEVIEQIKVKLPEEIRNKMSEDLDRICRDAGITAPELMYLRWMNVFDLLRHHVGFTLPPGTCWQRDVWECFSNKKIPDSEEEEIDN